MGASSRFDSFCSDVSQLDDGFSLARSDSTRAVKARIFQWIDWERVGPDEEPLVDKDTTPPSQAPSRALLGFNNPTTAKLLCPCIYNSLDIKWVSLDLIRQCRHTSSRINQPIPDIRIDKETICRFGSIYFEVNKVLHLKFDTYFNLCGCNKIFSKPSLKIPKPILKKLN